MVRLMSTGIYLASMLSLGAPAQPPSVPTVWAKSTWLKVSRLK
jgi:hypothetical protein